MTSWSRRWCRFGLIALVLAGCGLLDGTPASLDGTYAGSFSGTVDVDDLARKGIVELRIVGRAVTGVFVTGLGRAISFGAADGLAGRSLRVSPSSESRCTQLSGEYSEIAEPDAPPRPAFTGRLACPEFTAEWRATRVGPATVGDTAASQRFTFTVRERLDDATVGLPYRYSFCDPEPGSSLLCGGVVAVDLKNPAGGSQPFTFQKEVGDPLPWGLRLGSNGVLEGTPQAAALQGAPAGRTYGFRVCAVDSTRSYICRATLLTVLPAAAASPTVSPTPSPTASPTVSPTPSPTPRPTPTTAAPASRSYTGSVSISTTYARTDSDFGTHQVQAMADLPFDVDFARRSQSTTRTVTFPGSYSVNPKPTCGGSAGSGSYSGSVSYFVSGRVDAARDQVTFSVLITNTRSSPDLGVCWTKPELLLFTSGALDTSGNSFSFALAGGEVRKSGVLTFHESASKKTSYTLVARLVRAP